MLKYIFKIHSRNKLKPHEYSSAGVCEVLYKDRGKNVCYTIPTADGESADLCLKRLFEDFGKAFDNMKLLVLTILALVGAACGSYSGNTRNGNTFMYLNTRSIFKCSVLDVNVNSIQY